jgi:hypothetical protein
LIDFNRAKARKRDVQIFFDQQFGKVRQLDRQTRAVPAGIIAALIVGKSKGSRSLNVPAKAMTVSLLLE